jgi:DNA-binding winged helix-turn-helix (wHTH) protein/tetratricopeptide (TPR) repeat protein
MLKGLPSSRPSPPRDRERKPPSREPVSAWIRARGKGFRLGPWQVWPERGELTDGATSHHLEPKGMEVLVHLARTAGQVVSREALLEAVWPETFIQDSVLFRHISDLRRLLGDDARNPRFIETIPKRGYRLMAAVAWQDGRGVTPALPVRSARSAGDEDGGHEDAGDKDAGDKDGGHGLRLVLILMVLVVTVGAAVLWQGRERPGSRRPPPPTASRHTAAAPLSNGQNDSGPGQTANFGVGANDARAYELYLESLAGGRDPEPNREAIAHLTEAVERDPDFAPAWASLAERLYLESAYGAADELTADQALAAARRAVELDPDLVSPGLLRVVLLAESSRLAEAFDVAWRLVGRQPGRAESHLALSYVYRYAGLLEEAARECDIGMALSPANYRLRSCALVFDRLGRFDRAQDFLDLEPGSEWALIYGGYGALQQGRPETARRLWRRLPEESVLFGILGDCLERPTAPETARRLKGHQYPVVRDPEAQYLGALLLDACGRPEMALEMLAVAARLNYCALSALESEPVFADLHGLERWPEVHASLAACREAFLAHRENRLTGQSP